MNPSWVRDDTGADASGITLTEAKLHLRVPSSQTSDDTTISSYIKVATKTAEDYMARGLGVDQAWKLILDRFENEMYLPMAAPLRDVASVKYYDTTGTLVTLATSVYDVDSVSRPARITLKTNQTWPATIATRIAGVVEIHYTVGYDSVTSVPERFKQGIRLYVGYLYGDREGGDPDSERARRAAYACWDDRVVYIPPACPVRVA